MIEVYISDECYHLVQNKAILPFSSGKQIKSGEWKCEISESTFERFEPHMLRGETFSDTLLRILLTQNGAN